MKNVNIMQAAQSPQYGTSVPTPDTVTGRLLHIKNQTQALVDLSLQALDTLHGPAPRNGEPTSIKAASDGVMQHIGNIEAALAELEHNLNRINAAL